MYEGFESLAKGQVWVKSPGVRSCWLQLKHRKWSHSELSSGTGPNRDLTLAFTHGLQTGPDWTLARIWHLNLTETEATFLFFFLQSFMLTLEKVYYRSTVFNAGLLWSLALLSLSLCFLVGILHLLATHDTKRQSQIIQPKPKRLWNERPQTRPNRWTVVRTCQVRVRVLNPAMSWGGLWSVCVYVSVYVLCLSGLLTVIVKSQELYKLRSFKMKCELFLDLGSGLTSGSRLGLTLGW